MIPLASDSPPPPFHEKYSPPFYSVLKNQKCFLFPFIDCISCYKTWPLIFLTYTMLVKCNKFQPPHPEISMRHFAFIPPPPWASLKYLYLLIYSIYQYKFAFHVQPFASEITPFRNQVFLQNLFFGLSSFNFRNKCLKEYLKKCTHN